MTPTGSAPERLATRYESRGKEQSIDGVPTKSLGVFSPFPQVLTKAVLTLLTSQINRIISHARNAVPAECCGLVGGAESGEVKSIYSLRNVAINSQIAYEAAPEDLFAAQQQIRERSEKLLAIYHSHPRATEPAPSETDVRLAYYPAALYLIVALGGDKPVTRAFRICEADQTWQQVEYAVLDR